MSSILSKLINLAGNVTGTLKVNNGGTGVATLTSNGVLLGNGTSAITAATGTSSQVLVGGSGPSFGNVPAAALPAATISSNGAITLKTPTQQIFTISQISVTVSSANATVGATYTAGNGTLFTVVSTISSGTTLVLNVTNGISPSATSGTLTKTGGTGDSTITYSAYTTQTQTYTTPSNVLWIRVRMVGGGGGGSGSGSSGGGTGVSGSGSTFGSSLLIANGGSGGQWQTGSVATGGSTTINSPAIGFGITGGCGTGYAFSTSLGVGLTGGAGGISALGGAGMGASDKNNGPNAAVNSGSGASGGSGNEGIASMSPGNGGAAGGFIDAIIGSPSSTYSYFVGYGGYNGSAGTNGTVGGAGGSGIIIVEEHYY